MSLLDKAMEEFVLIDEVTVEDGYGGYTTTYKDGAKITAAFRFDNSMQAKTAQAQGVTSVYTIITKKSVSLPYHKVLRRTKDGLTYRVTSNGADNKTPDSAGLDMRAVDAERWVLHG